MLNARWKLHEVEIFLRLKFLYLYKWCSCPVNKTICKWCKSVFFLHEISAHTRSIYVDCMTMFILKFLKHAAYFSEFFVYVSIKNVQIHTDTYVFSLPVVVTVSGSSCRRGLARRGIIPDCLSRLSELGPPMHPLPRKPWCVSPLGPRGWGGDINLLQVRGCGTQFGRLNWKPGTLHTRLVCQRKFWGV